MNVRGGELLLTAYRLAKPRPYPPAPSGGRCATPRGCFMAATQPPIRCARPLPAGQRLATGCLRFAAASPATATRGRLSGCMATPCQVDIFEGNGQGFSNNVHLQASATGGPAQWNNLAANAFLLAGSAAALGRLPPLHPGVAARPPGVLFRRHPHPARAVSAWAAPWP
ncbi:MAG: hypothetical protein WKG07_21575 [Hymenobacter sp.]